jgi:hypothetical protein
MGYQQDEGFNVPTCFICSKSSAVVCSVITHYVQKQCNRKITASNAPLPLATKYQWQSFPLQCDIYIYTVVYREHKKNTNPFQAIADDRNNKPFLAQSLLTLILPWNSHVGSHSILDVVRLFFTTNGR